jgi:hypothetical protein
VVATGAEPVTKRAFGNEQVGYQCDARRHEGCERVQPPGPIFPEQEEPMRSRAIAIHLSAAAALAVALSSAGEARAQAEPHHLCRLAYSMCTAYCDREYSRPTAGYAILRGVCLYSCSLWYGDCLRMVPNPQPPPTPMPPIPPWLRPPPPRPTAAEVCRAECDDQRDFCMADGQRPQLCVRELRSCRAACPRD